jgi:hypothetical protein
MASLHVGRDLWIRTRPLGLAFLVAIAVASCTGASTAEGYPALQPTPKATGPGPTAAPSVESSRSAVASSATSATSAAPTVSAESVTSSASDGSWQVTFQRPAVSGVAAAATMNATIGKTVNAYIAGFTSGLPAPTTGARPSTLNGSYTVALATPTLLSLRFLVTETVAGADSNVAAGALSFVVSSGSVMALADLFADPAGALPVLSGEVRSRLAAKLGTDPVWPDSPTMASFGAFALTIGGLELTWSQGTVAAKSAGAPSLVVPWSALASVIAPAGPAAELLP